MSICRSKYLLGKAVNSMISGIKSVFGGLCQTGVPERTSVEMLETRQMLSLTINVTASEGLSSALESMNKAASFLENTFSDNIELNVCVKFDYEDPNPENNSSDYLAYCIPNVQTIGYNNLLSLMITDADSVNLRRI